MNTIYRTDEFIAWYNDIKDFKTQSRISYRIDRAIAGNFGDHAAVGDGVFEMRLHFGPGYRLYYFRVGETIYYLLGGGDKSKQAEDIKQAKSLKKKILSEGSK